MFLLNVIVTIILVTEVFKKITQNLKHNSFVLIKLLPFKKKKKIIIAALQFTL